MFGHSGCHEVQLLMYAHAPFAIIVFEFELHY